MSQFAFLSAEFPEVFTHASRAEGLALSDARGACFYARLALEVAVDWLYTHDGALREPFEKTLAARIYEATQVDAPAVNKWLFNADTIDKVLEHLMTHGLKVADGDRLGKTIIFAKNHAHAQFIQERFDINYPHLRGSFARVIAISVDMLDTGIDVPEVLNLVFFKIVRSKTKFWQMLGRGTRLCPDIFGPGRHKEFFYVFDFCQNFEFFNQNPQVAEGAGGDSLAKRLFVQRVELLGEIDKRAGEGDSLLTVRTDTAKRLHDEVAAMSLDNFIVRPKRRAVEKFAVPEAWQTLDLEARAQLIDEVAGLPTGLVDDDQDAKQFDLLLLRTQLALLRSDRQFAGLKKTIVEIASELELVRNIPMVAAELALILELQTDEYWQDITVPMLETVRRRLRSLVKLVELKKRTIVFSDFEDEIGASAAVQVSGVSVGTDMERFRARRANSCTRTAATLQSSSFAAMSRSLRSI
jgi:type I restriction enzyme R subunit